MEEFINVKLQEGDPKKDGINGCCLDDVLTWCMQQIAADNTATPKKENIMILKKIQEVLDWIKIKNQNIELGK